MPPPPIQQRTLTTLVDELRRVGVGVSVGEHLDAARALASIPLADVEVVRSTLQCALIKRAEHVDAFNLLFELYFSGTGSEDELAASMSDAELEAALRAAIESGDAAVQRLLADEYVRRFAGLEPGAPVAGVFAQIAVNEAANLDGIRTDLLANTELLANQAGAGNGDGDGAGGAAADLAGAGSPGPARSGNGLTVRPPIAPSTRSGLSCAPRSGVPWSPIAAPRP